MSTTTPRKFLQSQKSVSNLNYIDGPIMQIFRWVAGSQFWNFVYRFAVLLVLKKQAKADTEMPEQDARTHVQAAAEFYYLFFLAVVCICYSFVYWAAKRPLNYLAWLLLSLAASIVLYRLFELLFTLILLFFRGEYETFNPMRTFVTGMFAILQFMLIFGTLYEATWIIASDHFGQTIEVAQGMHVPSAPFTRWIDGFYFSATTFATVGYGDYSPESPLGKGVSVFEMFVGIFVLIIVIGKVVSASMNHPDTPRARETGVSAGE